MSAGKRDAIRERLQELADANHGRLTPEIVVTDAKKASSPLHDQFTWDVKKAAHEHWLDTARSLIRDVRIVFRDERTSMSVVAYVRDPTAKSDEQGYVSINSLRDDREQAREVVVSEFIRAAGALRRAREIAAVLGVEEEIDGVLQRIDTVKNHVEARRDLPGSGNATQA